MSWLVSQAEMDRLAVLFDVIQIGIACTEEVLHGTAGFFVCFHLLS